jgi:hypothetical protein
MTNRLRGRWPTIASWLLVALVAPSAAYGLLASDAYRGNSTAVVATSRGQDVLTLVLLPVLLGSAYRSRSRDLRGHILWLGLLFYLAYSYAIYLVGWRQNAVFVLYAATVTIAAASLLDGLARVDLTAVGPSFARISTRERRLTGWFLVVIGGCFTALWLVDVLPMSWGGQPPAHVGPGGTPYAVYVLDLVVALPVVVATGIMLIRDHPAGPLLGSVVIVKVTTLFLVLWAGTLVAAAGDSWPGWTADLVPSAVLPMVGLGLIARGRRRLREPAPGWLRVSPWDHGHEHVPIMSTSTESGVGV